MSKISSLKSFMSSRSISPSVVEMSLKVNWKDLTDENAEDVHRRLAFLLGVQMPDTFVDEPKFIFDDATFADISRAHGFDNDTIVFLSKIENSPGVERLFQK